MRVDNLTWRPVRLGMRRVRPNTWWISREDEVVGEVALTEEGWTAVRGCMREFSDGHQTLAWDRFARVRPPSFVTAALYVSRLTGVWTSSDGPQDLGDARVLRVCSDTQWYTVLLQRGERYIYEDHTIPVYLTDKRQARIRAVLVEVDRWEKENL